MSVAAPAAVGVPAGRRGGWLGSAEASAAANGGGGTCSSAGVRSERPRRRRLSDLAAAVLGLVPLGPGVDAAAAWTVCWPDSVGATEQAAAAAIFPLGPGVDAAAAWTVCWPDGVGATEQAAAAAISTSPRGESSSSLSHVSSHGGVTS